MLPPDAILNARPLGHALPLASPRCADVRCCAVGSVPVPVEVELRPDSAATINVARTGFKHVLVLDDGSGGRLQQVVGDRTRACRSVLPVDLSVGVALGSRPPSLVGGFEEQRGRTREAGGRADLERLHFPATDVLLLEGSLFRVGDTPTTNGRPLRSHGEASFTLDSAPCVFGIFGTHPLSLRRATSSGSMC